VKVKVVVLDTVLTQSWVVVSHGVVDVSVVGGAGTVDVTPPWPPP
jgi:hypothetical protein